MKGAWEGLGRERGVDGEELREGDVGGTKRLRIGESRKGKDRWERKERSSSRLWRSGGR